MAGYNPHNGLHEYYAATGGCVADANRAEAAGMRMVGNTALKVAEYATQDKTVTTVAKVTCALAPIPPLAKGICIVGVEYMGHEAINNVKEFVKTKVSEAFQEYPTQSTDRLKKCMQEEKARRAEFKDIDNDFFMKCIADEIELQEIGAKKAHAEEKNKLIEKKRALEEYIGISILSSQAEAHFILEANPDIYEDLLSQEDPNEVLRNYNWQINSLFDD